MIDISKVIICGDSWSSCVEADTGKEYGGYPEVLGIPMAQRFAIPGSTAKEWVEDKGGILTRAVDSYKGYDTVIFTLGGNDLRHAFKEDGKLEMREIYDTLTDIVKFIHAFPKGTRKVLLTYANPYQDKMYLDWVFKVWRIVYESLEVFEGVQVVDTMDTLRNGS